MFLRIRCGGYVELSKDNSQSTSVLISANFERRENFVNAMNSRIKGKGLEPYKWHYIDGGRWLFGVYGTKVQSTYIHYGRTHSATAKNGMGAGTRVKVHAGVTAFSQVNATTRNNKAYYNVY